MKNRKNMKKLMLIAALLPLGLCAQDRYATRDGNITFTSDTPVEKIHAENGKVTCVFDAATGAIEFAALIRGFEFEKALMQEHFNENYMESAKFPKATFKGTLTGLPEGASKPGTYPVTAAGVLSIHGVTKGIEEKATIVVNEDGTMKADCTFIVAPEDHDIVIPSVVRKSIAETVQVVVALVLAKM
ncbi:MAG: YceI family protein [Flavobacteriales bacterium]|nr:YceI family protein [Flavobacteriales bacterium]HQX29648.1 YceI family protein [Flavobacteriales bacterium]HQX38404.1 YceI family protein [Flavobacteriales bacterium]HQZ92170.1 YceI family protein [Flavobacteriales bacterium]